MKKLLFFLLIALGIFLRIYKFDTLPAGFFIDEINIGVDAKSLIENGTDQYGRQFPFVFEDATDYKLPGYIYAAAMGYKIFGPTLTAVRVPSLITSILTIFLLGFFVYLLFPTRKYLPWFAMIALSLSPFAIHFARIGYETTLSTFFILLYITSLFQVLHKRKIKIWTIVGLISLFIANLTYPAPRFILPVFTGLLLVICFFLRFKDLDYKFTKKSLLLFFIGNALSFIPPFLFTKADQRPLSYLVGNQDLKGWAYISDRIRTVGVSLLRNWNLEFLFDKGVLFAYRHGTKENGIFLQIFSVSYAIGLIAVIRKFAKNNFAHIYIALFTLVAGFPSALTSTTPYATRILPIILSLSIIIALGTDIFFTWLGKQKVMIKAGLTLVYLISLLYQTALVGHTYFLHFPITGAPEFPAPTRDLGLFIKSYKQDKPNTHVYFLNDINCRPWGNDALHLWYFANLPSKEMIVWNSAFRTKRYSDSKISAFDAYDKMTAPTATISGITFFPGYIDTNKVPAGSLMVYCGAHLGDTNAQKEETLKVFYLYEDVKLDPYYFITRKL